MQQALSTFPSDEHEIPDGFQLTILQDAFLQHIGPFYVSTAPEGKMTLAFRALPHHINRYGRVHGGMLATVADVAIGINVGGLSLAAQTALTLNLSVDYIGSAVLGDWVEASVVLTKNRGKVRFGNCQIQANDRAVVSAQAVFYASES